MDFQWRLVRDTHCLAACCTKMLETQNCETFRLLFALSSVLNPRHSSLVCKASLKSHQPLTPEQHWHLW